MTFKSMTFKTLASAALMVLATLSAGSALSHGGDKAKYGGIVQTASDLSFELVAKPDGALLYVEDHGKPVAPAGMTGKLTVLNGSAKSEAEFAAAGPALQAKGVSLTPGAKAVAVLTTASKKTVTVRFTVK